MSVPMDVSLERLELFSLLQRMQMVKAPMCILAIVFCLWTKFPSLDWSRLDAVELFAGMNEITRAAQRSGRTAMSYDRDYDQHGGMDFNSTIGFLHAVVLILRLGDGAQHTTAPVCSSYGFINSGTSGRSTWQPLGNIYVCSVKDGNTMVARQVLLLYLCHSKGVFFMLENPRGSHLEKHPCFQALLRDIPIYRTCVELGDFGGNTAKAVWLYSNYPCIHELQAFARANRNTDVKKDTLVEYKINESGERKVYGIKAALRESQSYPRAFGEAVNSLYLRHKAKFRQQAADLRQQAQYEHVDYAVLDAYVKYAADTTGLCKADLYSLADLAAVFGFLWQA